MLYPIDTIVYPRRSRVERPSCRVAEGFGPDDATTTGPGFLLVAGANSRPVSGGHEARGYPFASFPHTRNEAFFLARRARRSLGDWYE